MKCDSSKEYVIAFCISIYLVFFTIFCDDSDLTLVWYFLDDFIRDFSTWVYRCFELTSLYEKWFWCIVLGYWIERSIWSEHGVAYKDSFYDLIISRKIWRESYSIQRKIIVSFWEKFTQDLFCSIQRALSSSNQISESFYFVFVHNIGVIVGISSTIILVFSFLSRKSPSSLTKSIDIICKPIYKDEK